MSKKSGYVPKAFKDAGTEEEFEGGKSHDFEPGAYLNFKAAGLITDEPKAAAKPQTEKGGGAA